MDKKMSPSFCKPEKHRQLLDDTEWDFGRVPVNELSPCLYYEYGREFARRNDAFKKITVTFHENFPSLLTQCNEKDFDIKCFELENRTGVKIHSLYHSFARICLIAPDFPIASWQQIPTEIRKQGIRNLDWVQQEALHLKKKKIREPGSSALGKFSAPKFFSVSDWSLSDDEILTLCQKWIDAQRSVKADNTKRGRIKSPLDLLKHLGNLRKMSFGKNMGDPFLMFDNEDDRSIRRSAKKAEAFLKETHYQAASRWGLKLS